MTVLPEVTRRYLNHHLDSSRWDVYSPRDDDIVITTSYKSGTTLCQQILYNLLIRSTLDDDVFPDLDEVSPWIDSRYYPVPRSSLAAYIDAFAYRRFLKTHLPLDGLPYFSQVRYLIIGRDPRDVFMSLLNHYAAYTDQQYAKVNAGDVKPMPRYEGNPRQFWRDWITRGWFGWEQEGYPFWPNMYHTQSYWDMRHLPNFLFLHYADLIADPAGSIRQICEFIGHELNQAQLENVQQATSFKQVKKQAVAASASDLTDESFAGGQATFINKGTNGRWRDLLTEEDLALYYTTRDRVLTQDCIDWLERPPSS